MTEREYKRLLEKLNKDYTQGVESLQVVWRLSNPDQPFPLPFDDDKPASRGDLQRLVVEAVNRLPDGEFTIQEVEAKLREANPGLRIKRPSVSGILGRLVGETVEIIESGKGRRKSIYRRRPASNIRAVNSA